VSGLTIDARRDGPVAVLKLRGEARLEEVSRLYDAARAAKKDGAKHLLLGLLGLEFMDSASVGAFIELDKEYKASGGSLVLFSCGRRILRLMDDMGLKTRFPIAADEASAAKMV
jgi:anti-anti-sigma factor